MVPGLTYGGAGSSLLPLEAYTTDPGGGPLPAGEASPPPIPATMPTAEKEGDSSLGRERRREEDWREEEGGGVEDGVGHMLFGLPGGR